MIRKKISLLFLFIVISVFGGLSASCTNKQDITGSMLLVIEGEGEYEIVLDDIKIDNGLISILDSITELEYRSVKSAVGVYLSEVSGLKEGNGKFLHIYTSVKKDFDVTIYQKTLYYEEIKLVSSGVGVARMTIKDGCVIYIALEAF